MVRMRRLINSLLLLLCSAFPAYAADINTPLDFKGRYDFAMGGIPFGKIDVAFEQDATKYSAVSNIKTVGIVKIFVEHQSHTTSKGTGANFSYPNVEYSSRYTTKGKPREADFKRTNGVITFEHVLPPEDPNNRPPVAIDLKSKAYDPVSLALGLRSEIAKLLASGGKGFTLDYYDGRRLTRGSFQYVGEKNITIGGKKYPVYTLSASRSPIAGFTAKELKRMKDKEPPLFIYLAKDTLIPLRLELKLILGTAAATLKM